MVAPRPGRSSGTRPSRRGRCPPRPPRPAAAALEGKELHEFHLSTNYRNSAEIYDFAADYAQRVGLDADLPKAVRSTGVDPVAHTGVPDLESATREAVRRIAGEVRGTIGVVVPVARRSEVNGWLSSWPELAADAPSARHAVDSSVAPSGEDRLVVLTGLDTKGLEFDGIVVVRPEEIEAESPTGRATLYVVLTRATQLLTTISSTASGPGRASTASRANVAGGPGLVRVCPCLTSPPRATLWRRCNSTRPGRSSAARRGPVTATPSGWSAVADTWSSRSST